ncbi:MAG: hypothetical protein CM15mP33_04660 [Candidatus Neomarinimicrobiota bacterium]|nr:MAG: hypothetical protein CM15mP33_04660 [Candidatus Neomarinimicrobiota bacterium]
MIEGLLSIEQSSPPEIGLDEKGLRKFSLAYYTDYWSVELGDIYQTWGRGLILNQADYQNLDFEQVPEVLIFCGTKIIIQSILFMEILPQVIVLQF